jgi:hypothetical protein
MLQSKRSSQDEVDVEKAPLVDQPSLHVNSKYQLESPLQYRGACGGKAGPIILEVFDVLWLAYVIYLMFQAIYSIYLLDFGKISDYAQYYVGVPNHNFTTVDVSPMVGAVGWVGLLSGADAIAFGWLLWALIVASSNCQAILQFRQGATDEQHDQLPYPPLKLSVWWSIFIFVLWSIALGAGVYYYYWLYNKYGQLENIIGFLSLMFLVVLFGIFSTVLGVCRRMRDGWDACLRCCKSPCYDC